MVGCPEPLFIQHATEAGDKAPEKNLEAELKLADKYEEYLRSVGRYDYAKQWPRIRFYHFKGQHVRMVLELFSLFIKHPIHVLRHFLYIGPRRFLHERKMRKARP